MLKYRFRALENVTRGMSSPTVDEGGGDGEHLPLVAAQHRTGHQAEETVGVTLVPRGPETECKCRAVDVREVGGDGLSCTST